MVTNFSQWAWADCTFLNETVNVNPPTITQPYQEGPWQLVDVIDGGAGVTIVRFKARLQMPLPEPTP